MTCLGQTRTWDDFTAAIGEAMQKQRERRGGGVRLLTETVVSPTLAQQLSDLLKELPEAKWHVWEPLHRDAAEQGMQMAFGEPVNAVYDFTKADVVLSLDADFCNAARGISPTRQTSLRGGESARAKRMPHKQR